MAAMQDEAMAGPSKAGPSSAGSAKGAVDAGSTDADAGAERPYRAPALVVVGMAGSGKTTLVDTLSAWLENEEELDAAMPDGGDGAGKTADGAVAATETKAAKEVPEVGDTSNATPPAASTSKENPSKLPEADATPTENAIDLLPGDGAYVINLDPAVLHLPYEPNVDIRDTVKYKSVMKEYSLGPNGAIITSLNLFATRFDQVLDLVEKRAEEKKAIILDTPGQIETFTWSASGAIITESLAISLPTVTLYVIDTPRSQSAMTFVSNMLYACSIMYKTRLPMIVVFNKVDVASSKFVEGWMRDYDAFDAALQEDNFAGTLARSIAFALEEFYVAIRSASVSASTGEGMGDLVRKVKEATVEYETDYRPVLEERIRARKAMEGIRQKEQLGQLKKDLAKERQTNQYDVQDEEADEAEKQRRAHQEALDNADPEEKRDYADLVKYLEELGAKGDKTAGEE